VVAELAQPIWHGRAQLLAQRRESIRAGHRA
jgi:hypothetical protein